METYLVQGCGVSIVCGKDAVPGWLVEIVTKGGVPTVQRWADGEAIQ